MRQPPIYLYDGVCVLCNRGVQYVLDHERAPDIWFVAIQSDTGRSLARLHGIDPENPETFLFIENGQVFRKSEAAYKLARHLDGPHRYIMWTRIFPRALRDFVYSMIARFRYRLFGRYDQCRIPPREVRDRFDLP